MAVKPKVVWVLGAGFSKSLGGPLLMDLFTHPRTDRLEARCQIADDSTKQWTGALQRFRQLTSFYRYEDGAGKVHPDEVPWSDPEQFVEFLDAVGTPAGQWAVKLIEAQKRRRHMAIHQSVERMARDARQYLAAVCSEFIPILDEVAGTERWRPYRRWGDIVSADKHHTVLTFNYDRVVEVATSEEMKARTPLPCAASSRGARYIKLHGSVDWVLSPRQDRIEILDPYEAIAAERDILIATPGARKASLSEQTFAETWTLAETALSEADVIVFVGYRFPESDAVAKTRVLGAIKNNDRPGLTIRTVLGPKRTDDVERLDGLLRWSLSHRAEDGDFSRLVPIRGDERLVAIRHERLWAEDFLTVFDPDRLHEFALSG